MTRYLSGRKFDLYLQFGDHDEYIVKPIINRELLYRKLLVCEHSTQTKSLWDSVRGSLGSPTEPIIMSN